MVITEAIKNEREYKEIIRNTAEQKKVRKPFPMLVSGLCDGARQAFYNSYAEDMRAEYGSGILLIVPDEREAAKHAAFLTSCGRKVLTYPFRDFIFHNITASRDYEHERLSVLSAIRKCDFDVVITTPDAALQYTMPREVLDRVTRTVRRGELIFSEFISFLVYAGYVRVDMVDGMGQYSVRGGILDVFPPFSQNPIRLEFFGDEVESIEIFDVLTQRRIEQVDSFEVAPARELLTEDDDREELKKTVSALLKKCAQSEKSRLSSELEALTSGTDCCFLDKYISLIYPQRECLMDYFCDKIYVLQDYSAVGDRLKSFEWQTNQATEAMLGSGVIPSKAADYCKSSADFTFMIDSRCGVICEMFAGTLGGKKLSGLYNMVAKQTVSYADNFELLCEDMESYISQKFGIVLLTENEAAARALSIMLGEKGIPAVVSDVLNDGAVSVMFGIKLYGYELKASKFVCFSMFTQGVFTSKPMYDRGRRAFAKKSAQEKIMSYADLDIGDYVVHVNHGIGQYLGIQSLTLDGVKKDFVKIKYAGTDMLYLPCTQLDTVSKYIGAVSEDGGVRLSKMGGGDWIKAKYKAKAAAKEMAHELIQLYAERMRREGFAFSEDDEFQREFDNSFEYEETDGQLNAINEIKSDMQKPCPMDRLLCGDVGFGKTEVALRAAFKAVLNSKQVAILVPTTILALQHYQTILSRMRGFPVKADMLSRFRTPRQQSESIRALRRGETDIIVGTHRIVSDDIKFKDLGLVIVDEEQRFGVAHKEKLKQLSANVDVLTLTATPIPRTLNMAMSGIRDMSVLEEAPNDRLPVQTYVLEYDDVIIAEAIKKELRRGGQVFYLHNRVETINNVAARVAKYVPENVRIAVAHGQMTQEALSSIWRSMIMGEIDILISTTIIETGVDVPNANTLIIEHADKMGLSQLHQLRGRVGRSSRRAYAYFTYPSGSTVTDVAAKRLTAIRDYTEFGSGFKIALRDLEIRGAGNLLGSEQHGHINSVGYDLYMKILSEAIMEEKGEAPKKKIDCAVDMKFDAYIPDKYILSPAQRVDIYKKIASIENEADLEDVSDELCDRYGDIPKPTYNLLLVSLIRSLGSLCGINKVEHREGTVLLYPEKINVAVWTELARQYRGKLLMNMSARPYISYKIKKGDEPLMFLCEMFKKYIQIQNNSAVDSGT